MSTSDSILTNCKAGDLETALSSTGLVYKVEQASPRNLWIYFDPEQGESDENDYPVHAKGEKSYVSSSNKDRAKSMSKELGCSTIWFTGDLDGCWEHYMYCNGDLKERIDSFPGIYDWCTEGEDYFEGFKIEELKTRKQLIWNDVTTGSAVRISQHFDLVVGGIAELDTILQNALHILGAGNEYSVYALVKILGHRFSESRF